MAERVEIVEMAPRDGLQNEARFIATPAKIALVDALSQVGFPRIEVASFVSPKWVPQMADGAAVLAGIARRPGTRYAALTPNLQGFQAALAAGVDEVAIFASASEGFSRANLNCTIAESLARFAPVLQAAQAGLVPVRGYVSMVTDCPFEGPIPPDRVARVVAALRDLGCYEVSLGDTIGQGRPETVTAMLRAVLNEMPPARLAGHFHDTAGRALENVEASLALGLRVFDAAAGGLGGCPYAPGAAGNVATEKLAARLFALGFETGLDPAALTRAAALARKLKGEQDV
ncbi:hydroxymethylglutaryl-CoA lyase [Rhodobacter capsulatus]|uniref:hydroxymethylglutaryl-CoA lyase n=1 Tax=Rhodobacter capsulatus TaxID=1061 RepID=UPI0006DC33D1|nr:hydroxymethylglutaryl-CoA lyase [Rhodobacter capsulatus]KQB17407.1 hydroxymethylglutaryl-CoA lyase [Rhodobacter capsulatus]KQB17809.1 hydroxymethylglutaryl-CoA lyase [Rhodobacter capsulatus]PZX27171.1 hydroxymethylglutaryl-CoA lyase [Rhodobacter capsulatus]QNR64270.1 hydroxymethylglutaryl-CoA lyase [Rhodobacter capsulatus]